jgi:hypothetical protein
LVQLSATGSLTAAELLNLWERGRVAPPAERPAVLLAAVHAEETAQWPIGRRDGLLLDFRARNFGRHLAGLTDCPQCGETIELEFDVDDIRTSPPADDRVTAEVDGREITFRLPNSEDLAAIANIADPAAARRELFARCLNGSAEIASEWNDEALTLVGHRMGEADRQADVQLALACPQCRHTWDAPFDIASFFWSELKARAESLLREVHELAAAYGWSEHEILTLSPARRAAYLEMVRA